MENVTVRALQKLLPAVTPLITQEEQLNLIYDKQADVLYVSLGKPQEADDTEIVSDTVLLRKKGNKVIGVTFTHFSSQ